MQKPTNRILNGAMQRGAITVEFAFLIIPLLIIVAGIVAFGRAFWYYDALVKGTRDGARFLSAHRVNPTLALDSDHIEQAQTMVLNAANRAQVPEFTMGDVAVDCDPDCTSPDYITVSVDYSVTIGSWFPAFVSAGTPTLSPETTMRYMR